MASEAIAKHPKRRAYSPELKSQVVAACRSADASVAGVALAHGINANIVHRWLREHARGTLPVAPQGFVALPLPIPAPGAAKPAPVPTKTDSDIRIEVHRGAGSVTVNWPLQGAASCAAWLRAALYVGADALRRTGAPPGHCFVEADVSDGVRSVGAELFEAYHTRICRPIGLTDEDIQRVVGYVVARLGHQYDLRNVWDLARYLLPTPPVAQTWRRRMLSLGSGDPTRAICSTLIAQAFQSIRYPILPLITSTSRDSPDCPACVDEILQLRHHSLFAPRDFDVSPYFAVVKPTLERGFDFHGLQWKAALPA